MNTKQSSLFTSAKPSFRLLRVLKLHRLKLHYMKSQWLNWRLRLEERRLHWKRLPLEEQQRREIRIWMWGAGTLLTLVTTLSVVEARQARLAERVAIPEGLRMIRIQLIGPDHEAALDWPDDVSQVDLYSSQDARPVLKGVDLWRSPRGIFSVLVPETLLEESGIPRDLQLPLRAIRRAQPDVGITTTSDTSETIRHEGSTNELAIDSALRPIRRYTPKRVLPHRLAVHAEVGIEAEPSSMEIEDWQIEGRKGGSGEETSASGNEISESTNLPPLQHLDDE